MALTKVQRNRLIAAMGTFKLPPEDFDWEFGDDEGTLRYRPTGAYFAYGGDGDHYHVRYFSGDGPVVERKDMSEEYLFTHVGLWLFETRADAETPDLWAQILRGRELLATVSGEGGENTPFTPPELEQIADQMEQLRDYVTQTYSLTEAQIRLLERRVDYLVEAASHVRRKDWLLMMEGLILDLVIGAVLPPEAARHILLLLLEGIAHILGGGPLGLLGG